MEHYSNIEPDSDTNNEAAIPPSENYLTIIASTADINMNYVTGWVIIGCSWHSYPFARNDIFNGSSYQPWQHSGFKVKTNAGWHGSYHIDEL